uniref:class I SAM-dependent methyltransferase n=1 Tax=Gelidibacter sp. TaxID=2018083 RepID=UPI00404B7D69
MNKHILHNDIQEFINNHLSSDINSILLKKTTFENVSTTEIVEKIEAKNKCKTKLPTWYNQPNIYYPNKLNIEQTSSETTAEFKSKLIHGNRIIDLTGGFGVDCFYFSKQFKNVIHCELNENLSEIVKYNFEVLNVNNIQCFAADGLEFLKTQNTPFDWIYIDPSRRHDSKGKVFMLSDCLPNVPENLELLWNHSNNILIKTSPLLDISIGLKELQHVKSIHIVAVNNDVKELLWVLEQNNSESIQIKTTNIKSETTEHFEFVLENETTTESTYSEPLTYLYEPNAAVMKSGGFDSITSQFMIDKLHKHSHLYTSDELMDFPGRIFKIETVVPYNKKSFKTHNIQKANITTRNFPETVESIRKKLNIKDGGDDYLFFTTNLHTEKLCLICKKV